MTVVTIDEAREQLPDLLRRAAAGERIVISDGDTWLASLGAPPPAPPTAEEIAAAQARVQARVDEILARANAPALIDRDTFHRFLEGGR